MFWEYHWGQYNSCWCPIYWMYWFRHCLGAFKQQVIIRTSGDQDACHHMASVGHNELKVNHWGLAMHQWSGSSFFFFFFFGGDGGGELQIMGCCLFAIKYYCSCLITKRKLNDIIWKKHNQSENICLQGNALENVIFKISTILFRTQCVNPSGAETEVYWGNLFNTMAVDALAPCVARSSTAMILTK